MVQGNIEKSRSGVRSCGGVFKWCNSGYDRRNGFWGAWGNLAAFGGGARSGGDSGPATGTQRLAAGRVPDFSACDVAWLNQWAARDEFRRVANRSGFDCGRRAFDHGQYRTSRARGGADDGNGDVADVRGGRIRD